MLIVIEMNVWATVQGIAIAIDRRGPSGRMEMKEGAGGTSARRDQCVTCRLRLRPANQSGVGEETKKMGEKKKSGNRFLNRSKSSRYLGLRYTSLTSGRNLQPRWNACQGKNNEEAHTGWDCFNLVPACSVRARENATREPLHCLHADSLCSTAAEPHA